MHDRSRFGAGVFEFTTERCARNSHSSYAPENLSMTLLVLLIYAIQHRGIGRSRACAVRTAGGWSKMATPT